MYTKKTIYNDGFKEDVFSEDDYCDCCKECEIDREENIIRNLEEDVKGLKQLLQLTLEYLNIEPEFTKADIKMVSIKKEVAKKSKK